MICEAFCLKLQPKQSLLEVSIKVTPRLSVYMLNMYPTTFSTLVRCSSLLWLDLESLWDIRTTVCIINSFLTLSHEACIHSTRGLQLCRKWSRWISYTGSKSFPLRRPFDQYHKAPLCEDRRGTKSDSDSSTFMMMIYKYIRSFISDLHTRLIYAIQSQLFLEDALPAILLVGILCWTETIGGVTRDRIRSKSEKHSVAHTTSRIA